MNVTFDAGTPILDREALLLVLKHSDIRHAERTIRKHCQVIGYTHDGRALYDMEACVEALERVPTRRKRART